MLGVPTYTPAREARSDGENELKVFFLRSPAQAPKGNSMAGGAAIAAALKSIVDVILPRALMIFILHSPFIEVSIGYETTATKLAI